MISNFSHGQDGKNGVWQFQEAKAKLSEVLNRADKNGRQVIIRNKKPFVILNCEEYNEYMGAHRSLMDVFLRSPYPDIELDISRSKETLRDIEL